MAKPASRVLLRPPFYDAETLSLFGFATYALATLEFQLRIRRWICNATL